MDIFPEQEIFCRQIGQLITWVFAHDGWTLTLAEGYVGDSIDKPFEDTPHLKLGLHFFRLAQDFNLRVNGHLITSSNHPAWKEIGLYWKSLDDRNAWGGDFPGDANHFSRKWGNFK